MTAALDPEDFVPFFQPQGPEFLRRAIRPPRRLDTIPDDAAEHVNDVNTSRLQGDVQAIIAATGPSRSNRKAAVAAFVLLNSLANRWVRLPPALPDALGPILRPGPRWRPAPMDRLAGLDDAEAFALSIIDGVQRSGRVGLIARRGAMDLIRWFAAHRLVPTMVGVSAAGVSLGVLNPNTAKPKQWAVKIALRTHAPDRALRAAQLDGKELANNGKRMSESDLMDKLVRDWLDFPRALRTTRNSEVYRQLEAGHVITEHRIHVAKRRASAEKGTATKYSKDADDLLTRLAASGGLTEVDTRLPKSRPVAEPHQRWKELKGERAQIARAPTTVTREDLERWIAEQAKGLGLSISSKGPGFRVASPRTFVAAERSSAGVQPTAPDAVALLCRYAPEGVLADLESQLESAVSGVMTMTAEEKQAALSQIDSDILAAMRLEAELVWAARAEGREDMWFAPGLDIRAIHGIR